MEDSHLFSAADLFEAGMIGGADSASRRAKAGAILGIGYGNGKQFVKRLNHYGITREEWKRAVEACEEGLSC